MGQGNNAVKANRHNIFVFVSMGFQVVAIILLIAALAVPKWINADVTTTPEDYLGHSDIDQTIGLFRSKTEVCCLGQYRFDTALTYCQPGRCNTLSGNSDSHLCTFVDTQRSARPVSFDCTAFKDGLYTTIVFVFLSLVLCVACVVVAALKLTLLAFPAACGATALLTIIPLCVFPLVSYKQAKDYYQTRFPHVVAGYTNRNVYDLTVELGPGYLVLVFAFLCIVVAAALAAVGAWKARKDERAARRRAALSFPPSSPMVSLPPTHGQQVRQYSDPYPASPAPVIVRDDAPEVQVIDQSRVQRANPIDSAYGERHPGTLTRQNVEYNDFVHRVDGTFA